MTGYTKHIISENGTGGYITFFRKKLHGKTEKNIVIIFANPDVKIDVKTIDRNITVNKIITPTHGMVPRTKSIQINAEEFNWHSEGKSLHEAVEKIKNKNANTQAVIWMGQRKSHTHYEISSNFKVESQWHYSKNSPYSIGIFQ